MLTQEEIAAAKRRTAYSHPDGEILHEHDDCIRIAYEWLDAQNTIKSPTKKRWALKHIVERWGGRYVSQSDVEVAAELHPNIHGKYPHFNISSKLTRPSDHRLKDIGEARSQGYKESNMSRTYSQFEK